MRGEVAQGSPSMLSAMRVLHPDGYAELRRWGEANQGPMPQAAHLNRATFMHVIGADETGHIRRGSAADASGHRWEHLEWVVSAGGADLLYELCDALFSGTGLAQSSGMSWVFDGRLIALCKPGDREELRRLRPIGMGSILLRVIGTVAARQFASSLGQEFDPAATAEESAEDVWRHLQAGVGLRGGKHQVQSTLREMLTEHPSWVVMKIDAKNAFNTCRRTEFFDRVLERCPSLFPWVRACYGAPTRRFVRLEDGSFEVVWSTSGTTQGDPLGPALFAFSMLSLAEELAARVRAGVLFYLDDGHVCGPPEEVAHFARQLVDQDGDHDMQRRTGCEIEVDKCCVWGPGHTEWPSVGDIPETLGLDAEVAETLFRETRATASATRNHLRRVFPPRFHGMRGLREPEEQEDPAAEMAAQRGLSVLGSPICGTDDFMRSALRETVDRAREYVTRAQEVLLPLHPDAYLGLMRTTLGPRFTHHTQIVPPRLIAPAAAAFDALVRDAYSAAVGELHSVHMPAGRIVHLSGSYGGQCLGGAALVADAQFVGTHAANAHLVWRRFPPLQHFHPGRMVDHRPTRAGRDLLHSVFRANTVRLEGQSHRYVSFLDVVGLTQRVGLADARARCSTQIDLCGQQSEIAALLRRGVEVPQLPDLESVRRGLVQDLTQALADVSQAIELAACLALCTAAGQAALRERATLGAMRWVTARPVAPEERMAQDERRRWARPIDVITAHQCSLPCAPSSPGRRRLLWVRRCRCMGPG